LEVKKLFFGLFWADDFGFSLSAALATFFSASLAEFFPGFISASFVAYCAPTAAFFNDLVWASAVGAVASAKLFGGAYRHSVWHSTLDVRLKVSLDCGTNKISKPSPEWEYIDIFCHIGIYDILSYMTIYYQIVIYGNIPAFPIAWCNGRFTKHFMAIALPRAHDVTWSLHYSNDMLRTFLLLLPQKLLPSVSAHFKSTSPFFFRNRHRVISPGFVNYVTKFIACSHCIYSWHSCQYHVWEKKNLM